MMYLHLPLPKETRSLSALHAPVTGVLASAHGISHSDRAILAVLLCERWGADLPPPHENFQARLYATITHQEGFWAKYLGVVAAMIGAIYPAGTVDTIHPRLKISARWADGLGKKGLNQGVRLKVHCRREDSMTCPIILNPLVDDIEKVGKKKNRVGGEHGYGVPIEVEIERDLI
jgi:retrograde regulation protein 2